MDFGPVLGDVAHRMLSPAVFLSPGPYALRLRAFRRGRERLFLTPGFLVLFSPPLPEVFLAFSRFLSGVEPVLPGEGLVGRASPLIFRVDSLAGGFFSFKPPNVQTASDFGFSPPSIPLPFEPPSSP